MSNLEEISALCNPISDEQPTGRDLEQGLELNALETAAQEPEEPSIQGVSASDERNWTAIAEQARGLLTESKDLRVAVIYTRALLCTQGLPGFAQGVQLLRHWLEQYWVPLYPHLEEDQDAQLRVNTLAELWGPAIVSQLRASVVVSLRELGAFSVNDVLVSKQSPLGRPGASKASASEVRTALDNANPEDFARVRAAVDAAASDLRALAAHIASVSDARLDPRALVSAAPGGAPGLLDALARALAEHAKVPAGAEVEGVGSAGQAPPRAAASELESREDVVRMLDRICDFYARREPSSPVPLFLQRAKRLATMDFVAIVRDLADKGLPQIELFVGGAER